MKKIVVQTHVGLLLSGLLCNALIQPAQATLFKHHPHFNSHPHYRVKHHPRVRHHPHFKHHPHGLL